VPYQLLVAALKKNPHSEVKQIIEEAANITELTNAEKMRKLESIPGYIELRALYIEAERYQYNFQKWMETEQFGPAPRQVRHLLAAAIAKYPEANKILAKNFGKVGDMVDLADNTPEYKSDY
jgi:hypothetical protein